jgi:hypothetical protein
LATLGNLDFVLIHTKGKYDYSYFTSQPEFRPRVEIDAAARLKSCCQIWKYCITQFARG